MNFVHLEVSFEVIIFQILRCWSSYLVLGILGKIEVLGQKAVQLIFLVAVAVRQCKALP